MTNISEEQSIRELCNDHDSQLKRDPEATLLKLGRRELRNKQERASEQHVRQECPKYTYQK